MMNEDNKKKLVKSLEREKRRNYFILYIVVLVVWILLVIYAETRGFFSSEELVVNIINNIIGILPPILIFDFFNEKLSRDASTIEMSNKLTETLMSNPETLELFTEEQREVFVTSTINSMVDDEDAGNIIVDSLKNNLHTIPYGRIRTEFDYSVELHNSLPGSFKEYLSDISKYYYVQEKFHYRVKYLAEKSNNLKYEYVTVGFMFNNKSLDESLRETEEQGDFSKCIFRETLDVLPEDIQGIKNITADTEKFQQLFKVDLQIDGGKGELVQAECYSEGILCRFKTAHDRALPEHVVRIIFHMPKRWNSIFEIAIVDPTKAPKVFLSYPEDSMNVEMYPFLSKGKESSVAAAHEHLNGIYDISINNEWIYPIGGIVFSVEEK